MIFVDIAWKSPGCSYDCLPHKKKELHALVTTCVKDCPGFIKYERYGLLVETRSSRTGMDSLLPVHFIIKHCAFNNPFPALLFPSLAPLVAFAWLAHLPLWLGKLVCNDAIIKDKIQRWLCKYAVTCWCSNIKASDEKGSVAQKSKLLEKSNKEGGWRQRALAH